MVEKKRAFRGRMANVEKISGGRSGVGKLCGGIRGSKLGKIWMATSAQYFWLMVSGNGNSRNNVDGWFFEFNEGENKGK